MKKRLIKLGRVSEETKGIGAVLFEGEQRRDP